MASVSVEVRESSAWTSVSNVRETTARRVFGPEGEATFVVQDATTSQRELLRMHRWVRIALTEGAKTTRFIGVILRPRVVARVPGEFDMEVTCVDFSEAAKTVYPLLIDPLEYPDKLESVTTTTLAPSADAEIDEDNPSTNAGSAATMEIDTTSAAEKRALIQFDLSGITSSHRIDRATLHLHPISGLPASPLLATASIDVKAHLVTASWVEGEVTWNNRSSGTAWSSAGGDYEDLDDEPEGFKVYWRNFRLDVGHEIDLDVTHHVRRQRGAEATGSVQATNNGYILIGQIPAGSAVDRARTYGTEDANDLLGIDPSLDVDHHAQVLITDVVEDVWDELFPSGSGVDMDTSGVQSIAGFYIPEETRFTFRDSLFDITEALRGMLPNVRWWLDWTGNDGVTDDAEVVLRFEQQGSGSFSIGEDDIAPEYEIEPTNQVIRNIIAVEGQIPGGVDENNVEQDTITALEAWEDSDSTSEFGELRVIEPGDTFASADHLQLEARSRVAGSGFEYWRIRLELLPDYADIFDIKPGDQIGLNLPTVGIDGSAPDSLFGANYLCLETEDTATPAGYIRRQVTLVQTLL